MALESHFQVYVYLRLRSKSLNFHVSHPKNLPSSQETDDFHEVGPAGHQIPFGK